MKVAANKNGPPIPRSAAAENRLQGSTPDRASVISNTGSIEVHIGELVLHGFSHADRFPIADAVEQELARLFSEDGVPSSLARHAEAGRIGGGAFRIAPSEKQTSIGEKVARAIYGGLR